MKERPILFSGEMVQTILDGRKTQTRRVMRPQPGHLAGCDYVDGAWWAEDRYGDSHPVQCPYGEPGDRLWVRETFIDLRPHQNRYAYRATDRDIVTKWKPSIFMPREASRITLTIIAVRSQRLQDITEDQAAAEGIERHPGPYILDFARLWDKINAKRGYSWASNPWVWVLSFSVVEVR